MHHSLLVLSLRFSTVLTLLWALGFTATPVFAVDGVLEISQACVADGCFAGDSAGFPVTLALAGSYRLTSSLTVPDAITTAIEMTASDITLDLNGFKIGGPTVSSGDPIGCAPTGAGIGVVSLEEVDGLTVKNGTVSGFGLYGVLLQGDYGRVENLLAENNRFDGIHLGSHSVLLDNHAWSNGSDGLASGGWSRVEGNVADSNGVYGLTIGGHSRIAGNIATNNESDGINASGSTVIEGNTSTNNDGDGIEANTGCVVLGNSSTFNGGFGLMAIVAHVGYSGNTFVGNNPNSVSGGTEIGTNFCGSSTTCP